MRPSSDKEKDRSPDSPGQINQTPTRKDLRVIIQQRGEPGPDANLTPDPRKGHTIPKLVVEGVRE